MANEENKYGKNFGDEEIIKPTELTIHRWNSEKGFGFVKSTDGKDVFIHFSAFDSSLPRGIDLTGRKIILKETKSSDKGLKAVSATLIPTAEELEVQNNIQKQKDQETAEWHAKNEKQEAEDMAKLLELMPTDEEIQAMLPLPSMAYGKGKIIKDGIKMYLSDYGDEVLDFDTEKGPTIRYSQRIIFSYGKAEKNVEPAPFIKSGWDGVSLLEYQPVDPQTGEINVNFNINNSATLRHIYPGVPHTPVVEGNSVVQYIVASTPIGEAKGKLELYSNPQKGTPKKPLGDYKIDDLINRVDNRTIVETGVDLEKMPDVEIHIETFHRQYVGGGRWESDDGYIGGDNTHDIDTSHGGVVIEVASPFMRHKIRSEGFDRESIIEAIKNSVNRSVESWKLTKNLGERFGEKLIDHIISKLPQFVEKTDLWLVDTNKFNIGIDLDSIAHGLAQIKLEPKEKIPQSKIVDVVSAADAKRLNLPGEPLPGPVTVYWPEAESKRVENLNLSASGLHEKLLGFTEKSYYSIAPEALRKVIDRLVSVWPNTKTYGGVSWFDEAKKSFTEFSSVEEELVDLDSRLKEGKILVDWKGKVRRRGVAGNQDHWVIMPDGELREADVSTQDEKQWRVVKEGELALTWYGDISCRVELQPETGLTPAQLETVKKIERDDLHIPENAFHLDPEKNREYEEKLKEIRQACNKTDIFKQLPELDYLTIISKDGQFIEPEYVRNSIKSLVNVSKDFNIPISNREGQIVQKMPTNDGVLEFIVYEKSGTYNLNIRWHPEQAEEIAPEIPYDENSPMAIALRKALENSSRKQR